MFSRAEHTKRPRLRHSELVPNPEFLRENVKYMQK